MDSGSSARSLYQDCGVNVEKGEDLVRWLEKSNSSSNEKHNLNDFSASFEPNFKAYKKPLLVSSTDGVGTKLLLAINEDKLEGLGFDLVAMCVNDLYTSGAKHLFFLDYFATSSLNNSQFKRVLTSIQQALNKINCPLLGGETAELPGLYQKNHFDLAGFVVGVVDKERRMSPSSTKEGDLLYGFSSSGFHSNGYTLLRSFLGKKPHLNNPTLLKNLLAPTEIYYKIPELFNILGPHVCHSACHVTGGGISGNLKRILPQGLTAHISFKSLKTPQWIKDFLGEFSDSIQEFESVLNMGCGMILAVNKKEKEAFETNAKELGLNPYLVGEVVENKENLEPVSFCA